MSSEALAWVAWQGSGMSSKTWLHNQFAHGLNFDVGLFWADGWIRWSSYVPPNQYYSINL